MAKKRTNRGGAQRAYNGSSSGTPQRPANGANATNATNGTNGAKGATATASPSKSARAAADSQSDRIAAARARNAAARAAAERRRSMQGGWLRRRWPIISAVVVVVLIIAVFFAMSNRTPSGSASIGSPVPASILGKVTGVSQSTYEKVGKGTITNPFKKAQGNPPPPVNKAADGRPIILYVGADYCPFCAAERWPMVMALSRFGTFKDLTLMQSSSTDTYPNTNTFSFHGSSYTSQYLDFQSVETQDRTGQKLDSLTSAQQAIFDKYDAPPYIDAQYKGSIPFISVANQYIEISAGFIPDQMQGMTWQEIADKLNDPNSSVTRSIVANANYITAAICQVTDNKPANVCTAAPIPQMINDMKAGK